MGYPIFNEANLKDIPKGLYLGLMHGRASEDEDLYDWGTNGPLIGPLKYVHTTYGRHTKFEFEEGRQVHLQCYLPLFPKLFKNPDCGLYEELFTSKDCSLLVCAGVFYGDWSVFYNDEGN